MAMLGGKKGLVIGIANEHSLAHGCARHFRAAGADLALTCAYAAFLVSDTAKAITGNIAYVDAGYHVVA